MELKKVSALIGVSLLVMVANIAASILYMVVYGHVIDPGHEPHYYQVHIQTAGPYCSIIGGFPIMFLAGWWVAGWWQQSLGIRGGLFVWFAYMMLDLSILLIAGISWSVGVLFVISFATKLLAIYFGARTRLRQIYPDPLKESA